MSPENSYGEVLLPSISECDCIGNEVFKEVIKEFGLNEITGVGRGPEGLVFL